ncbi:hypothetical protein BGZ70_007536 [Mortierella alpina]|uniref:MD-2-related lipid-recognition domain-containing protein n=1 Tax=Mortierella alpina TaxID=64518 RepID=A0A9P6J610_MORAP|nr:hypothetical protein BGZ70_007536 [Mortierella alpina]
MKILTSIIVVLSLMVMTMTAVRAAAIDNLRTTFFSGRRHRQHEHALALPQERFSSCGSISSDIFSLQSVKSSQHLCSGCKACVSIEGLLKGRIERGAKVTLKVSKFFFTVLDKTYDLCDLLEKVEGGPKCPMEPTYKGLKACLPLDKSLISANIKVSAVDAQQRPLFCIEGTAMVESRCPAEFGPGSVACTL